MKRGFNIMNFEGKKALVCGMARSGISAAEFLKSKGADVTLQDLKKKEALGDVSSLENKGIKIYAGKNPDDIANDMDIIVLSPGIPTSLPFIVEAEKNGVPVISEIELSFMFTPCPVMAITGTNGKTTTTTLTGEILKSYYPKTEVVGNIGIPYSEKVPSLTEDSRIVAEISSFQLEKIKTFKPKVSAVLNITPDHLDRHKTVENYIAMKERIFENQTSDDFCVLNCEDEACLKMADKTKAKVMFFSSKKPLEKGIYLDNGNIILKWEDTNETVINIDELQILGVHNYENVMAAVAIGFLTGVPMDNIREVLKNFKGVEHRIEFVDTVDGVDYYNDSKGTNPDAAIRAVLAMKKPIVLIGGGYDKGSEYDEWVETFEGRVKHIVLIGVTAQKIKETCYKYEFRHVTICETFDEAMELSKNIANEGDCVLLSPACASWGMFDNYEQRGDMFKEKVKSFKK